MKMQQAARPEPPETPSTRPFPGLTSVPLAQVPTSGDACLAVTPQGDTNAPVLFSEPSGGHFPNAAASLKRSALVITHQCAHCWEEVEGGAERGPASGLETPTQGLPHTATNGNASEPADALTALLTF